MTIWGLLIYFLFFSVAEAVNFFISHAFFAIDIHIPILIFFSLYFSGYGLFLSAGFFGLLSGLTQGNSLVFIFLFIAFAYVLQICRHHFLISSRLFISLFTFMAELIKALVFYFLVYKGQFVPKFLFTQTLFYVFGNALLSVVFYDAFRVIFYKMKQVYEKGIRNS